MRVESCEGRGRDVGGFESLDELRDRPNNVYDRQNEIGQRRNTIGDKHPRIVNEVVVDGCRETHIAVCVFD